MIKSLQAIVFLTLSFSHPAWAQTPKEFALKSKSWITCQPEDSSPQNLFNCCVYRARTIQVENIQNLETIYLKADPKLCLNPDLQNLRFKLNVKTQDGVYSYLLESPRVEDTPFYSNQQRPTSFWIHFVPRFDFPLGEYWKTDFFSFLSPKIGIDEKVMPGLSNRLFGGDATTILGWKMQSSKLVFSNQYASACPPHMSGQCLYQENKFNEIWLNQDSQAQKTRTRSEVNKID